MTVYQQIDSNKFRTLLLTVLFIVLVGAFVEILVLGMGGDPWAGVVVLLAVAAYALFSYRFSDAIVLRISGAKEVKHDENPDLYHIVENLCIGAGLPMPKVYLIEDSAPNAFATGRDPEHATVVVTSGLLQKLERLELEGVIAHELSHIKSYDIRLMSLAVLLVGIVALLADLFFRYTWYGAGARPSNRRRGGGGGGAILLIIALIAAIIAPIAAQFIRFAISRRRESLADASAALLTRYPEGLARALEKISADKEPLEVANKATAHLFIVNPLHEHQSWLNNLFSTHPPVEERIAALRAM